MKTTDLERNIVALFNRDFLQQYSNIVKVYHEGFYKNKEDYSQEAFEEITSNANQLINNLKLQINAEADEILNNYEELSKFKFPDRPEANDTSEKLLQEMQRNSELMMVRDELKSIDDPNGLIELARKYEDNPLVGPEVDRIVKNTLKARKEQKYIEILDKKRNPELTSLNRAKNLSIFLANTSSDHIPVFPEGESLSGVEYRSIKSDLKTGKTPVTGITSQELYNKIRGFDYNKIFSSPTETE